MSTETKTIVRVAITSELGGALVEGSKAAPADLSPKLPAWALTVIVPTFNERDNVARLLGQLREVLVGLAWQVVFVDDNSRDGTDAEVLRLAAEDPRVSCVRRIGRRGLAGAVLEGVLASTAPIVAVIDADLQHDARLLPSMFEAIDVQGVDLVVGSRFLHGQGLDEGLSPFRRMGSRAATWLARRALKADVSDPVSGFFMARREVVERVAPSLSTKGFKILFDIIASQPSSLRVNRRPRLTPDRHPTLTPLALAFAVARRRSA